MRLGEVGSDLGSLHICFPTVVSELAFVLVLVLVLDVSHQFLILPITEMSKRLTGSTECRECRGTGF